MSMDIVNQLVSQLGINEEQAKGGMGLLLGVVKDKLGGSEFAEVAKQFDNPDEMMAAAPESGGLMGAIGGLLGGLGGDKAAGLGNLAELAGGFSKLDLDPSMIQKFVPIVTDFLQQQGGDGVVEMIKGVLGGSR